MFVDLDLIIDIQKASTVLQPVPYFQERSLGEW